MTQDSETLYSAMKAAAWERAKDELRACVAISGSRHGGINRDKAVWEAFNKSVEDFIVHVEENRLTD